MKLYFLYIFKKMKITKKGQSSIKIIFDKDHEESNQQQLAGMVFLTFWHLTQTSSTSLHPSMTHGSQHRNPVVKSKQQPQAIATPPVDFLVTFDVLVPQNWHGVPSLSSLLIWITVGPWGAPYPPPYMGGGGGAT